MDTLKKARFKCANYLATSGVGRRLISYKPKTAIFVQGGLADFVFYLHSGRAKLTVVSKRGKEATVTLLASGDFLGEESLAGMKQSRMATACTDTTCVAMKIDKLEMLRVLHEEPAFADFFLRFMLDKGMRTQADLIDQLFNSSERRLARTLLLMADYGKPGEPESLLPSITQETLAEMIGTTRSRVSFFMNRFRKLGYIEYKGRIRVHKSLLNAVLKESLPEENTATPTLLDPSPSAAATAKRAKVA
jgi:CRP/FNR family cyclic AMP-dependent transcriptional regulator